MDTNDCILRRILQSTLFVALFGCGSTCPSSPTFVLDDVDPDLAWFRDRQHALRSFLQRTGPSCIDEVVWSPVAPENGELFWEPDGWTLSLQPWASPELARWHVCAALYADRRPLRDLPAQMESFLDETRYLELCADPIPVVPTCGTEDLGRDFVRDTAFLEDAWDLAPAPPVLPGPAIPVTYTDYEDRVGQSQSARGLAEMLRDGDDLVIRWLTPTGASFQRVPDVPEDLVDLVTDGRLLVGRVRGSWDAPTTTLLVFDIEAGSQWSVVYQGPDRYTGRRTISGHYLVRQRSGFGAAEVMDLDDGTLRELVPPPPTQRDYAVEIQRVFAHPTRPGQVVASWTQNRYESVLIDVINVYGGDDFLGTIDLESGRFEVVKQANVASGLRLDPVGVTSWGEVMLHEGTFVDLETGAVRRPQLPCHPESSWLVLQDQAVAIDTVWQPYLLFP